MTRVRHGGGCSVVAAPRQGRSPAEVAQVEATDSWSGGETLVGFVALTGDTVAAGRVAMVDAL